MIPDMQGPSTDETLKQFGARVRQLRLGSNISQVELARLANVSRSAVVNLESGAGSSLTTLVRVLDALGRSDWLMSLEVPTDTFNPLDLLDEPPHRRALPARPRVRSSARRRG